MSKRVLIIDDEESIRKAFILGLKNTDFEIETAENGEVGIAQFSKSPFDLVFCDLNMPGLNGVETMYKIHAISSNVQFCFLTAFYQSFSEELDKAKQEGISFSIESKPLQLKELQSLVNGYFN